MSDDGTMWEDVLCQAFLAGVEHQAGQDGTRTRHDGER